MGYLKDLSDDHMEGRAPGTAGYDSAASYVVAKLSSWGLKPGGDKDYYQSITFRESRLGEKKPQFSITDQNGTIDLEYEQDYILFPRVALTDANIEAEMVFIENVGGRCRRIFQPFRNAGVRLLALGQLLVPIGAGSFLQAGSLQESHEGTGTLYFKVS